MNIKYNAFSTKRRNTMLMRTIPQDVKISKNRVTFGLRIDGSSMAVVLPRFTIRKQTIAFLKKTIKMVGNAPRMRQDSPCEEILKKSLGADFGSRFFLADGHLIPTDQEAATMLLRMKLPMLKIRHFVPIWQKGWETMKRLICMSRFFYGTEAPVLLRLTTLFLYREWFSVEWIIG